MITLYGAYRSRMTRNVWLLEEAGLPYRIEPVLQAYRLADPQAADAPLNTQSAAFLALSPAGAIPVLKDGDLVLSESLAINLHLARRAGAPLGPRDAAEDAVMQQWALYGATEIEPDAVALMYVYMDGRADTADGQAARAAHAAELVRPLKMLDAHFAQNTHLVGGRFTVADINLAEILRYADSEPGLLAQYPAVHAWLKAAQSRPAFQAMWARRLAEPA